MSSTNPVLENDKENCHSESLELNNNEPENTEAPSMIKFDSGAQKLRSRTCKLHRCTSAFKRKNP